MPEEKRGDGTWLRSYQFADMENAGRAYRKARDIAFGKHVDLSVYRCQIRGTPHVVLIGEPPLPDRLRRQLEEACAEGRTVEIPPEISSMLKERRRSTRLPGAFWEANYRPGRVVDLRRRRHPPR